MFAASILVLYALLAVYARGAAGGTGPGETTSLELFGAVAVLVALAGVLVSVGSAPRAVELRPDATVFVGRFGQRLALPPRGELEVRVLRRHAAGLLSSRPVELVEVAPKGRGRRRGFLLEEGLLDVPGALAASG